MKLKKLLLPVLGMTLALSLAACNDEKNKEDGKDGTDISEDGEKDEVVVYTKSTEILERVEDKDTFAFVIGNATCGACQAYKAEALKVLSTEEGIKLPFIETLGIDKDKKEYDAFVELIDKHLDGKFEATPTTYFIVEGKLVEEVVGAMPYGALIEKYEKHIGKTEEVKEDKGEDKSKEDNSKEDKGTTTSKTDSSAPTTSSSKEKADNGSVETSKNPQGEEVLDYDLDTEASQGDPDVLDAGSPFPDEADTPENQIYKGN